MNKHLFLSCSLLGILLIAPMTAMAQINEIIGTTINANTGTFTPGNILLKENSSNAVFGLVYDEGTLTPTPFDGTIKAGTISVTNISEGIDDSDGKRADARGVWFRSAGIDEPFGNVTLGDIFVKSATKISGSSAAGLRIDGAVMGTLSVGKIYVESAGGNAIGVHAVAVPAVGDGGIRGITQFDAITVKSGNTGNANDPTTAAGIWTNGPSEFTLKGDINVTAVKGTNGNETHAYGVVVQEANAYITIDGNVKIFATGADQNVGIAAGGELTLDLADGARLQTDRTRVDNGQLYVVGNGYANLGFLDFPSPGSLDVGMDGSRTTVAIDGARILNAPSNIGIVTVDTNSILEVYGNTTQVYVPINTAFSGDPVKNFRNTASLTDWQVVNGEIMAVGVRDRAYANDNYLAAAVIHHRYTGWNAVRDHVISGATVSRSGHEYCGQEESYESLYDSVFCNPKSKPRGAWANYVGRDSRYRSSFNHRDWKISTNGVQIGTDFFRAKQCQFGAFFGYEGSDASNIGDRLKARDHYIGLYDVNVFRGGSDLRTIFTYGWQNFDSLRNDPSDMYRAAFKGNTAELNVEWGKRRYFGEWSARPAVAIDWYWTELHGGREVPATGTGALQYDKMNFSQLFFRFGSDLRYECGRWAIESGLFYSYDMRGSDLWSGVSDVETGTLRSALVGSKVGRSILSYNLSSSYAVCKNFTIFGGYRGEVSPERAGDSAYTHTGYVGGAWRW